MSDEFSGVLDLSGAQKSGFEAVPSGTYDCELFEWKLDKTSGKGKLPEGCPLIKVQFKIIEPEHENKRLFHQFAIPPTDYDAEKRATMMNIIFSFFLALGEEEADVKNKKFNIFDCLNKHVGDPVRVTTEKVQKYGTQPEDNEWQNNTKGIKPATEAVTTSRVR